MSSVPVELFPGVRPLLGSTMGILAGLRYGPRAGFMAGLIAGLPTLWVWNQPWPVSALIYGLEGMWVGIVNRHKKRGPLVATLSYWIMLGSWLTLGSHLLVFGLPALTSFIAQTRSVVNGMMAGLLVETGILLYEITRKIRTRETEPARLGLESLVMIVLVMVISLPMLYVSTTNSTDMRERARRELADSSARSVALVQDEMTALLERYRDGVAVAASALSADHNPDSKRMSDLLGVIRSQYPEFGGMSVVDARGQTIAADPLADSETALIYRSHYRVLTGDSKSPFSWTSYPRDGASPMISVAKVRVDSTGSFAGYVAGWFGVERFQQIASKEKGEDLTIVVADADGNLIGDSSVDTAAGKISLAGRSDFEFVRDKQDGAFEVALDARQKGVAGVELRHLNVASMPVTGWKVWGSRSLQPLKNRLDEMYLRQIVVLMVTLLAAVIIAEFVARLLIRPITALQLSAERMSDGDLSARPATRSFITAELDSLYRSFDRMADSIDRSLKRQQELLREVSISKGEWESTFHAMADSVAIVDSGDRLIRANKAFYEMLGLEPGIGIGESLTDLVHPQGDWDRCDVCKVRREGRRAYIISQPAFNRSGRYIGVRVDPVFTAEGERMGTVQVVRDLSEVRKAEEEAEKAGALLQNLVDGAYEAMFATQLSGTFLWANRRAADLFSINGQPLEGATFFQAIHSDDLARVRGHFEAAAHGEAQEFEARLLTADDVRQVLVTASPVYAAGEAVTILGVARDITSERLLAEQNSRNDKLRALGQLASGVAHNFNNSLTAVIGYTQMALTKIHDAVLTRHLKTVETAALDAAKMVQRIQNFARQRQDEAMAPCDLNQILRDALDLTRSRWRDDAHARGVVYDVIFRPTDRLVISCDQSAMREVFVNLIINALDAMPQGGRLIITTTVEREVLHLTFTDTGCGMTDDIRQRIFEPFFTTKGTRGYGMGLSVTYGIIERHGGDIHVTSELGSGSSFTIQLPIRREVTDDSEDSVASLDHWSARTASVLVVDDEAPIRALLADLLRARGHKVLMAEDGLAGLRAIEGARFDLVITDISMPGVDGWAVVSEVRRRWPDTKLVIVTGYGGLVDQVFMGGESDLVDALISKPFNLAEIDSTINDLLLDAQKSKAH
jgi:PAS domain S-box-containing protein